MSFRIAIVADLDTDSKVENKKNLWKSYLKKGYLSYSPSLNTVVVTWDTQPPLILSSSYALKGRGMELSELVVFDGRLLTFDDRSGMVGGCLVISLCLIFAYLMFLNFFRYTKF